MLSTAIGAKDFEQIKSIAHSVKGASGNISAKHLRETCLRFEEIGKSGQIDGAEELLGVIDKQFEEFLQRVVTLKEELGS